MYLEVIGYSDSDFVGCIDSQKLTSRYIFVLAGGAISWRSAKQTLVTTSTMGAEIISCFGLRVLFLDIELSTLYLSH